MRKNKPLSAVLLAGGLSSRMGRDKAFLEINGQPLWNLQIAKLEQLASETFISVREADSLIQSPYQKIPDPPGARGPLGGLASALGKGSHPHLLVLAVDLPAMTSDYLDRLFSQVTPTTGVVPELDGFFQGTCAIYPKSLLPLVEEILGSEDHSFQHLIRRAIAQNQMTALPVSEADRPLFANWNTPESLNSGSDWTGDSLSGN